jgi:non-specific serine/threonine protein kinase/serine/threonine-protein kinase
MNVDPAQVRAIFLEAVEKQSPDTWDQFLDDACTGDNELRRQVANLLAAHCNAGAFLARGAVAPAKPVDAPAIQEGPGTVIGPYKLLEEMGEGGFGVVFLAEQSAPIRRKVALKILKPGMDTRQVVARFEAERQALALMDHPHIAHVFDGGATASGRPYFVMELVKGVPITDFCDQNRLTPRQRLELFLPVCQAVQHAHQKGIIHRDLKPSNVMVSRHDTTPVIKVIDFGVAKAMGQELTDKTLFTGLTQMIGTPLYMSPEQAGMSDLDIDTRSDIYSLGVLLYELLTGTTPFDRARFKQAAYEEIRRIIREEDPPRPSTRLSRLSKQASRETATPNEELTSISARRHMEPAKLTRLLRGELDWIVMKSLEKNRSRRYATANDFAADLQRYLADEPVQACPPSAGYRLRKFARRNRGAVLAVTTIFLLLIGAIAGTTWGLVRAEQTREEEMRHRKLAEAAVLSERAAKGAEAEQRSRAEKALRKAGREAAIAAAINNFLDRDLLQLSSPLGQAEQGVSPDANLKMRTVLQRAAKRIDGKFPKEPEVEMKLRYTIGYALLRVGDYAGAFAQYEKVVPYLRQTLGPNHAQTLLAEYYMASMHRLLGHADLGLPLLKKSFERHLEVLGPNHGQTLMVMNGLATAYNAAGQKDKALQVAEQTLELRKRHLGPTNANTLVSMNNVASLYLQRKELDKALALYQEALAGMQTKFSPLHPERLNTTRNLARTYRIMDQIDRAVPLFERVVPQYTRVYGLSNATTQNNIELLITCYVDMGWCDKAEALVRSLQQAFKEKRYRALIQRTRPAAELYQRELATKKADHPDTLAARQALALVLRSQQHYGAAAYHLRAVLEARQRLFGADHPDTCVCRIELATTRLGQGKYAEAWPLLLNVNPDMKRLDAQKKQ